MTTESPANSTLSSPPSSSTTPAPVDDKAAAALLILVNEGLENWQSLWTSAVYLLLGTTLWPARFAPIASWVSRLSAISSNVGMLDPESSALRPIDVAVVLEPNSLAKKAAEGATTVMAKGE